MAEEPMRLNKKYALRHTTRDARCMIKDLRYRINVSTLHREEPVSELRLNEIGRVSMRTTAPLLCDPYRQCRLTGSFIVIDEATNVTVGAGMIL
jgi:sulfate adenylyltransferase subunit 1 (EFTu-like GTPase family)